MRMKSLLVLLALLGPATSTCYSEVHGPSFVCRRRPRDFRTSSSGSDEVAFTKRHHQRRQRSTLTKHEYVQTVLRFLEAKYWRRERPSRTEDVKSALGLVYEMLHRNIHGLVVFTSHVVFSTGGLLKLQAGDGRWTSRGILQITGEANYRKLAWITESDLFLRHPRALATLQQPAVEGSVLFWLRLLEKHFGSYEKAEISLWKTLLLLNPSETRRPGSPESETRIRNRKADYNELRNALEARY